MPRRAMRLPADRSYWWSLTLRAGIHWTQLPGGCGRASRRRFYIDRTTVPVSGRIGVAIFPEAGLTGESLLKHV